MRKSEFTQAVTAEFGEAYGRVVTRDVVLPTLGNRTAVEAVADGVEPGVVWLALCEVENVPAERRHGRGLPKPPA